MSNVSSADAKNVEKMVRQCVKHLKKKKYELDLPNGCVDAAIKCLTVRKTAGVRSFGGPFDIKINIAVPVYNGKFCEYKSFGSDPIIGDCKVNNDNEALFVLVAHEVSHHVQYRYCPHVKRFRYSFDKPHGECFKTIYRYLRRDLVNPKTG